MGAGDTTDHHIQDAAEAYLAYIVQKELLTRGLAYHESYDDLETDFEEYCAEREICDAFNESPYKDNLDKVLKEFVDKLASKYPGKKMDITNVEVEYRNRGLKADFLISFNDDTPDIPVSLKNYRKGFHNIQLCSGTFHSFANRFVLNKKGGPGQYEDCDGDTCYSAQSCRERRNEQYLKSGCDPSVISNMEVLDLILDETKDKFLRSDEQKMFNKTVWKNSCKEMGERGIEVVMSILSTIPNDVLKGKFMEMTDLCHKEELLLVGPNGDMMCSLFNDKYKSLLLRANKPHTEFTYRKHLKSLILGLKDEEGEILSINVPFTLQRNGAWYTPKERYEGKRYHKKEKIELAYGERRPKKSKEMNTSTNMWFKIKKYL